MRKMVLIIISLIFAIMLSLVLISIVKRDAGAAKSNEQLSDTQLTNECFEGNVGEEEDDDPYTMETISQAISTTMTESKENTKAPTITPTQPITATEETTISTQQTEPPMQDTPVEESEPRLDEGEPGGEEDG